MSETALLAIVLILIALIAIIEWERQFGTRRLFTVGFRVPGEATWASERRRGTHGPIEPGQVIRPPSEMPVIQRVRVREVLPEPSPDPSRARIEVYAALMAEPRARRAEVDSLLSAVPDVGTWEDQMNGVLKARREGMVRSGSVRIETPS